MKRLLLLITIFISTVSFGQVVFDETYNSKVDVRESRMRPKTNNEAKDDVIKAAAAIEEGQNFIKIRI